MITIKIITNDINKAYGQRYNGQAYLLEANQDGVVRYFVASGVDVNKLLLKHMKAAKLPEEQIRQMDETNRKLSFGGGWEVLIFPSNKNGDMLSGGEVAGGKDITHREAIENLRKNIREHGIVRLWEGTAYDVEEIEDNSPALL